MIYFVIISYIIEALSGTFHTVYYSLKYGRNISVTMATDQNTNAGDSCEITTYLVTPINLIVTKMSSFTADNTKNIY